MHPAAAALGLGGCTEASLLQGEREGQLGDPGAFLNPGTPQNMLLPQHPPCVTIIQQGMGTGLGSATVQDVTHGCEPPPRHLSWAPCLAP